MLCRTARTKASLVQREVARLSGPRRSPASAGSSDGRYAPKPPLCKGRCRPYRAAEGLFPSGGYSRAASDYELLNSRAVRSETVCVAAIPQSATLTAPFTQRGLCAVRQCVPFPLAAQVRQWGPRGSPAPAGSPGRGGAAERLRFPPSRRKQRMRSLRRRGEECAPQNSTILPARAAPMRVNPNSFASATDSAVGMALLANTGTPARMTFSTISTGILPLV